MAKEIPELFQNVSHRVCSRPKSKVTKQFFYKTWNNSNNNFKHSHVMWHNPNKLIWYNAWPQENNKSLFFCHWSIVFLENRKLCAAKARQFLMSRFRSSQGVSGHVCWCCMVKQDAPCEVHALHSEPRVQCSHLLQGHKLSDHLRLVTHLILNSFLALGHSETFHCCQIFSHTPTLLYNPWGDDPQFKKL